MTTKSPITKGTKKTLMDINPMAVCVFNPQTRAELASSKSFGVMLQPITSRWFLLTDEEKAALVKLGFSETESPEKKKPSVEEEIDSDRQLAASLGQLHAVAVPMAPPSSPVA